MTNHTLSRHRARISLRAVVLLAALAGLLTWVVPVSIAGAAPIDDLRAQAQQLESQMNDLGSQLGTLYEQIKSSQYQIDQAKQQIADAQTGIAMSQAAVQNITALVRQRAATVYKKAGLDGVGQFETDIREQVTRKKYADVTNQRDGQLLVKLAVAKEDLAARQQSAEKLRGDLQKQQDTLKSQQAEFQTQQAQLQKLKDGVTGQIAQLVAVQEAARRAAEAKAAAALKAQTVSTSSSGGSSAPTFDTSKLPPVSGRAGAVVSYAAAQLGKPYCYAGTGPDCFDCSGLTMMAWAQAGVYMPHNSEAQYGMFPRVPLSQVQPGDIVWFPGHVGIYAGGGVVINATHTGDYVRYHDISLYQGAVRPG